MHARSPTFLCAQLLYERTKPCCITALACMAGLYAAVQDEFAGLCCLYCPAASMHMTLLRKPRTARCSPAAATPLCITAVEALLHSCWSLCIQATLCAP
jgi:hypothetical protein